MSLLAVEQIDARHGQLQAVRDVSFAIDEGEILALIGANGAGKTTLLRAIAGAHRIAGGSIVFDGRDVSSARANRRVGLGITLVPEGRRLFAGMTVEENLLVGAASGRRGRWNVETVLEAFPMLRPLVKRRAGDLSGGQQQATAIGRSLMSNPRVLLVDENKPFCGIGAQVASMIQEKLFDELDAPVLRVNSLDSPAIYSPKLEIRQLPRPTDVVAKVLSIC